ncbi:MAG: zinc-dependent metalloprotease [Leptolyngbyaceae cyanobacterium bins.59]|nr:zinc-dependent metalloprotease [Leptolyngbyaceae cyanobacterium bins.59]
MRIRSQFMAFLLGLLLVLSPIGFQQLGLGNFIEQAVAQQTKPRTGKKPAIISPSTPLTNSKKPAVSPTTPPKPTAQPFDSAVKGFQKLDGLFTLYQNRKAGRLLAEIKPDQLNVNYLWTTTLESGVGESGLYSGLPLSDFLFYFRQVNNTLQLAVRNVYFRAQPGDPLQRSINRSFSDSVLFALPIRSTHPQRKSMLVDITPVLMSDFPGLAAILSESLPSSYSLDSSKSYLAPARAFPLNLELESVYNFTSSRANSYVSSLPDGRALTLRVRYSLSELPAKKSYKPRLADQRVGYFITAYQDFSNDNRREPFVRYINRWQLEKKDPNAPLSPPKDPIVFWIENTVPLEYRQTVREGVMMWNQAFEKIGFKDAIEVKQMPDRATWDPADVRYNTIRWFNSLDATFAMGPSRVNPLTGQILDADIIVDANFLRFIKQEARIFTEGSESTQQGLLGNLANNTQTCSYRRIPARLQATSSEASQTQARSNPQAFLGKLMKEYDLCYGLEVSRHFAVGSNTVAFLRNASPTSEEMKDYTHQFLREIIAHEVGHTLGLRHNFHGSTLLKPEELNNLEMTRKRGLVSSVMDYNPANLAPKHLKQGDYFTPRVGPYDEWAIEYGYKPIEATVPQAERRALQEIAQRAPQPELAYGTDEDLYAFLDPGINAFDMSGDMITYSQWQMDNAQDMWSRLEKRYPIKGESFSEARSVFDKIFFQYFNYASVLPQYIGGQSFSRNYAGDPGERPPFEGVSLAQQRQALTAIQKYVFDDGAFRFSPALLNKLAPSRWSHWGSNIPVFQLDYPIYDRIFFLQRFVLADLLSPDRLARLRDAEMKSRPGEALTIPELFQTLQSKIWQESLEADASKAHLSSLRRAIQRDYLETLTDMVLRRYPVPDDARTVAWYQLRQLRDSLGSALRRSDLDTYTRAHYEESRDRIVKALEAPLQAK